MEKLKTSPSLRGGLRSVLARLSIKNVTRQLEPCHARLERASGSPRVGGDDKEDGNALWFILVAISLLGLLTVMMSRSGSSTNETGNYEQNVIAANEILSYAKNMENAVQNLLARGCSENELSFWHDSNGDGTEDASDLYYNPNAPTDHSCHLFDVAGAGLTWKTPDERWSVDLTRENQISARHCIRNIGDFSTTCNNQQNNDLILFIADLKVEICLAINNMVDIVNVAGDAPETNISLPAFTGVFTDPSGVIMIEGNFTGKQSGCAKDSEGTSIGKYFHYHVLHAR